MPVSEVHHFGPAVDEVGGMASVLRAFRDFSIGADVVAVHPTWSAKSQGVTLRYAARAASIIARLPRHAVVHVHLAEGGAFVREGGLLALAHRRGNPTAVTLHGADYARFANKHPRVVSSVLSRARLVVCLDPDLVDDAKQRAVTSVVAYVPNPVVIEEGLCDAADAAPTVLFAGEVGVRKGADIMRDAWPLVREEVPDAECTMVGPATALRVAPADGLTVLPPVDATEVRRLIRRARCVALPSRAEAMPMILLEAMAAGRPFVSTPVGGIPTLAAGGRLVPVGDARRLADELVRFLKQPQLSAEIGNAGREECRRTRSVPTIDRAFRELYATAFLTDAHQRS